MKSPLSIQADQTSSLQSEASIDQGIQKIVDLDIIQADNDAQLAQSKGMRGLGKRMGKYSRVQGIQGIIKGLGVYQLAIAARTASILDQRLRENPQRFQDGLLGSLTTFLSRSGKELVLAGNEPTQVDFGKLSQGDEYSG